ncbi:sodium-dependent transporter [Proteinivorax hydrogeniformans]|uniref:Sodium-dependent transporter n=1 Tax=Proteinivorax hydrogeniformans TaxID=1826727 RepID=A0AAU8HRT9_9FIRM
MADKNREQWGSRIGFILAAAGSAIGLGNIWRFPTVVGQSGGGAFLLVYLIITFLVGIPLMIAELTIGRKGQTNIVGAFKRVAGKNWGIVGALGVAAGFIILSFYSVIAGWGVAYIFKYITGELTNLGAEEVGNVFNELTSAPIVPLFWHAIFMLITIGIVILGIDKGIEKASKLLMPILLVLLILLAIRSVTLDGAMEGVSWYLRPNFAVINRHIILSALGQAFFSFSLGMGAILTYGSYLGKKENIPGSAVYIAVFDIFIAVLAGFIIIPAVFAFGLEPGSGPPLIFITLPAVFGAMPAGNIFGLLFFVLLTIAAVTSAISLLEVVVAYFIDELKWSRKKASALAGLGIFILGIPSSLSMGVLSENLIFGMPFLDFMDYFSSNVLLTLGGFFTAVVVGWVWKTKNAVSEIETSGSKFLLAAPWAFLIKWIMPVVLLVIIIYGLFF